MDPTSVGIPKNSMVLGKHSGRHAFKDRIAQLGYTLTERRSGKPRSSNSKRLPDKKKEVFDERLGSRWSMINWKSPAAYVGTGWRAGDDGFHNDSDGDRDSSRPSRPGKRAHKTRASA